MRKANNLCTQSEMVGWGGLLGKACRSLLHRAPHRVGAGSCYLQKMENILARWPREGGTPVLVS